MALSSVSIANAKDNLDKDQEFEKVKTTASVDWNKALSKITVETPVDSLKTIFYTALYHAQVAPVTYSDKNGQFRREDDTLCATITVDGAWMDTKLRKLASPTPEIAIQALSIFPKSDDFVGL